MLKLHITNFQKMTPSTLIPISLQMISDKHKTNPRVKLAIRTAVSSKGSNLLAMAKIKWIRICGTISRIS